MALLNKRQEQHIVKGIKNLGMLAVVVNIVEELSENGINRHEGSLKKKHKITAESQGQTCHVWSKNVGDLALRIIP